MMLTQARNDPQFKRRTSMTLCLDQEQHTADLICLSLHIPVEPSCKWPEQWDAEQVLGLL